MRHSNRYRHLKHVHRGVHNRRMSYFMLMEQKKNSPLIEEDNEQGYTLAKTAPLSTGIKPAK